MTEQSYKVLGRGDVVVSGQTQDLAVDVLVGLSETPKRLPSRLFYDAVGSRLFQEITELEAYYPTRKEFEIFTRHGDALLEPARNRPFNLIDLGAGDGRKTVVLLDRLMAMGADVRYVPIDISEDAMKGLVAKMAQRYPSLPIAGLVSEYFDGIRWLSQTSGRRNLVLFLGSNVGNFNKAQARGFLRQLWNALSHNDLALIGFDLKKDIEVLLAAYNDPQGVTSRFNLNLLDRLNRELGADFDRSRFRHFGTYNVVSGAMESYLVSLDHQEVRIPALSATFEFDPWEPIHTEYSYKYLESDIDNLARFTGFDLLMRRFDEERWFCDALWQVRKS